VHPLEVHVAVYVPGYAQMDVPVVPLDHVTVPLQPDAVNTATPEAQEVGPAISVGGAHITGGVGGAVGHAGTTIGVLGMLVKPLIVQVAVYVPGDTVIEEPVIPLDHVTVPPHPDAAIMALLDGQEVGPFATVGGTQGGGVAQGCTVTGADGKLVPALVVHLAV
jgi:hypothetical protein